MWKSGNGVQYPWAWNGRNPDLTMGYRAPLVSDYNLNKVKVINDGHFYIPQNHVTINMLSGLSIRNSVSFESFKHPSIPTSCKRNAIVSFISNCVGFRMNALKELSRHVPVQVFGKCGTKLRNYKKVSEVHPECQQSSLKNIMPTHFTEFQKIKYLQYYEKICVYRNYYYVFAYENEKDIGYVSEKVYHALLSGSVPIYWGAPDVKKLIPSNSAIIVEANKSNINKATREIGKYISSNYFNIKDYLSWKKAPIEPHFLTVLDNQQNQGICKICEKVSEKKKKPLVILLRLTKEINSFYLNRTIKGLKLHGYEYIIHDSVDGCKIGTKGMVKYIKKKFNVILDPTKFPGKKQHTKCGLLGAWASHLNAWSVASEQNRSVISLESDNEPVSPWNFPDTLWKKYDIIFSHTHIQTPVPCRSTTPTIREGPKYWYSPGSLLFTAQRTEFVWKELRLKVISKPLGHWLNDMSITKKLKIGGLCPAMFKMHVDHESTIGY